MKPRLMLLLPILLALCSPAAATQHSATARLTVGGAMGSGTVFEVSAGRIFLVTNAHVATRRAVDVEFWKDGHASRKVPGTTIWADSDTDLAVLSVPASELGGVLPEVIPLAPPETVLRPGETIGSVGCPGGNWPTGFEGHVLGYDDGRIAYQPPPANGRSGSALFNTAGRIVGVINAQRLDRPNGTAIHGLAVPVSHVYRVYGSATQRTLAHTAVVQMPQCPVQQFRYQLPLPGVQRRQYQDGFQQGQQCGPEGCPLPQTQPPPNSGAFGGGGVFPSMPGGGLGILPPPQPQQGQGPPPSRQYHPLDALSIDLTPIADSLGKIGESLDRIEKRHAEQAEAKRQDAIRDNLPLNSLGAAGGAAVQGDWSGAGASLTGPEMAAWTAGGVAALLAGFFGVRGIFAVLLKFVVAAAVRLGFSYVHSRITAPERTEVDEVIDDVKPAGSP